MDLKDVIISGLRTNKLSVPIIADFAFENILPRFVKDSYDDIWEDFLEEDVAEALTHAIQEIMKFQSTETTELRNHVKRVSNDMDNYFKATNCLAQEHQCMSLNPVDHSKLYDMWDADAKKLIGIIASLKDYECEEYVVDAIWRRYCAEDQTDDIPGFCPDYRDLYEQIGDNALFADGDVFRAMLWYRLMPIDWECLNDEPDEELTKDQAEIKAKNKWWSDFVNNVELISSLSDDDMIHSTIVGIEDTMGVSDACAELLHEYLHAWGDVYRWK